MRDVANSKAASDHERPASVRTADTQPHGASPLLGPGEGGWRADGQAANQPVIDRGYGVGYRPGRQARATGASCAEVIKAARP